ncbi:MAG: isochorismatase family cysteine hydrolase [bacterium]
MNEQYFTEEQVLKFAKEAYENGDASFKIGSNSCALLVIDMQDEFVKPGWTPYWAPAATRQVPLIKELIENCRSKNIPVIYTVFSNTNFYLDRPVTGKFMPNRFSNVEYDQSQLFIKGKVWHELEPMKNEIVIHKPSYGAFYDTPLETILKNLKKDTVIICGALTNYCSGTTARQAYERGFKVVFGSDVNATDDMSLQETELKVLRKGFAKVVTAKEIMEVV